MTHIILQCLQSTTYITYICNCLRSQRDRFSQSFSMTSPNRPKLNKWNLASANLLNELTSPFPKCKVFSFCRCPILMTSLRPHSCLSRSRASLYSGSPPLKPCASFLQSPFRLRFRIASFSAGDCCVWTAVELCVGK